MTPPSADFPSSVPGEGSESKAAMNAAPVESSEAGMKALRDLAPLTFEDPYKAREYQKGRLALAFRIFAKLGFDEGVAGHITLRVSYESWEH